MILDIILINQKHSWEFEYAIYAESRDTLATPIASWGQMLNKGFDFIHGKAYNKFGTTLKQQAPYPINPTLEDMIEKNRIIFKYDWPPYGEYERLRDFKPGNG